MSDSWAVSRLVNEIKQHWLAGAPPDAAAALEANPHLRRWKSIVLDLAAEEYHLRAQSGQDVDTDDFCRRFPDYQRSLLHRLEVEQYLRQEEEQQARAWPEAGDSFLGYRLLQQLGKGAIGRVFLARQQEMRDRLVVVKITPRGRHEADTLALLNHPNIVPVYRYDEDAGTGFAAICMPYLSRTTLEDFLIAAAGPRALEASARKEPQLRPPRVGLSWPPRQFQFVLEKMNRAFPVEELGEEAPPPGEPVNYKSYVDGVLDLGRRIAEALAHTHRRGVLHLDLKPSNVLLLPDGRPMLLDFNLSVEGAIGASVIGGTLPYMAPEQLQEAVLGRSYRSRPVTGRSDLFSLGVILYELLAGRHPFGETPRTRDPREAAKELLRRHEAGPASLGEQHPGLDPQVAFFLESCLAFHPDQRPATAEEAAASLARLLTPRSRVRRWRRKHRKPLAVAVGVVAAGVLALAAVATLAPAEHERHFHAAQMSLTAGDLAAAETHLRAALAADGGYIAAWESLGRVQREQKKYEAAVESFHRAWIVSKEPRIAGEIASCLFHAGRYDWAEPWYRKAIEGGLEREVIYLELAALCNQQGRFHDAKSFFSKAVDVAPQSSAAFRGRALSEFNRAASQGELPDPQAYADIDRAVELSPENATVLFEAAEIHALAADPNENADKVGKYLERALEQGTRPERINELKFLRFKDQPWYKKIFPSQGVEDASK